MLPGGHLDSHGGQSTANRRMPEHIVGRGGFFDPAQVETVELPHPVDRLRHIPHLVGVDGELHIVAEFFAHHFTPASIVGDGDTHLGLEAAPPFGPQLAAQFTHLALGVAEPPRRRDVGRVTIAQQFSGTRLFARRLATKQVECLIATQRIAEIPEVDAIDELLGGEFAHELPNRHAAGAGPQVPHGVHDGRRGEVDDPLLGAEPTQLTVAGEAPPEAGHIAGDLVEIAPHHMMCERIDGGATQVVTAPDGEREAVPLEPVAMVGGENGVGRRVVGVGVGGVGPVEVQ